MRHHSGHSGRRHSRRIRRRLQTKLFWWFGATIILTGIVAAATFALFGPHEPWHDEFMRGREFVAARLAESWDDPSQRSKLVRGISDAFNVNLEVQDAQHHFIERFGEPCPRAYMTLAVKDEERVLGYVSGCWKKRRTGGPAFLLALAAACLTLWAAAAVLSRHLARPLSDLVRVTREIGEGNLSSRVALGRHHSGEVGVLAESVNDMAVRIERQLNDQRELLAAVSHEIRSPLSRLRVLSELLRDRPATPEALSKLEREVLEIDNLVGKLLASSRVDFGALDTRRLSAQKLALGALERAGVGAELLSDETEGAELQGDATLLGRAIGNLLENAVQHGNGVEALRIFSCKNSAGRGTLVFEVCDRGSGFSDEALRRGFDAFYRGSADGGKKEHSSLGLGLALVERIARAHGGRAWAENRKEGGARVSLEVPKA